MLAWLSLASFRSAMRSQSRGNRLQTEQPRGACRQLAQFTNRSSQIWLVEFLRQPCPALMLGNLKSDLSGGDSDHNDRILRGIEPAHEVAHHGFLHGNAACSLLAIVDMQEKTAAS